MKKFFYPRLAFDGIRKNKRLYLPYILTQIGMIMMYYIVIFLRYGESLKGTFGEGTVNIVLMLGGWVIAIALHECVICFDDLMFANCRRISTYARSDLHTSISPEVPTSSRDTMP